MTDQNAPVDIRTDPVSVLIADDRKVVRDAFGLVLQNAGIDVIDAVTTGREAIERALALRPEVVLLDIAMPEMDGLAALSVIRFLAPDVVVIILTSHAADTLKARAAELGAAGFIPKATDPAYLVRAIQEVAAGKILLASSKSSEDTLDPPTFPQDMIAKLEIQSAVEFTEQEKEIIRLMLDGCDNQSIVEQLVITLNTLKTHMSNIYSKMGVSSRTEAVLWALRNGYASIRGSRP
jgi:DNA-binding NarL/FixJ family response regulator